MCLKTLLGSVTHPRIFCLTLVVRVVLNHVLLVVFVVLFVLVVLNLVVLDSYFFCWILVRRNHYIQLILRVLLRSCCSCSSCLLVVLDSY